MRKTGARGRTARARRTRSLVVEHVFDEARFLVEDLPIVVPRCDAVVDPGARNADLKRRGKRADRRDATVIASVALRHVTRERCLCPRDLWERSVRHVWPVRVGLACFLEGRTKRRRRDALSAKVRAACGTLRVRRYCVRVRAGAIPTRKTPKGKARACLVACRGAKLDRFGKGRALAGRGFAFARVALRGLPKRIGVSKEGLASQLVGAFGRKSRIACVSVDERSRTVPSVEREIHAWPLACSDSVDAPVARVRAAVEVVEAISINTDAVVGAWKPIAAREIDGI